jgi:uncharacterized ion transporter superfamily protein YfcC
MIVRFSYKQTNKKRRPDASSNSEIIYAYNWSVFRSSMVTKNSREKTKIERERERAQKKKKKKKEGRKKRKKPISIKVLFCNFSFLMIFVIFSLFLNGCHLFPLLAQVHILDSLNHDGMRLRLCCVLTCSS